MFSAVARFNDRDSSVQDAVVYDGQRICVLRVGDPTWDETGYNAIGYSRISPEAAIADAMAVYESRSEEVER